MTGALRAAGRVVKLVAVPFPRLSPLLVAGLVGALASPRAAVAAGPVGGDPVANAPAPTLPASCRTAPTGPACVNAVVASLDRARAALGQPPYALPADFVALPPDRQALALVDDDRVLAGLPPVDGLTATLDADSAAGVAAGADPVPSDPTSPRFTSNWAGGYANLPAAYHAWMYEDGRGGGNLDCTAARPAGCWGHRHTVLWSFDGLRTALGAAAGTGPGGRHGDAMLIAAGTAFAPVFSYRWTQALADGAGTNAYDPGPQPAAAAAAPAASGSAPRPAPPATSAPGRFAITSVRVAGRRLTVRLRLTPGARVRCSLTARDRRGRSGVDYRRCAATTVYRRVPAGRYTLRVRTARRTLARVVKVR